MAANFADWLFGTTPAEVSWEEYQQMHSAQGPYADKDVGVFPSGLAYDNESKDSLVNAVNTARQWQREDAIRSEGYAREDNAYVNLFNQLKSMGINPALLMSSAGPTVGSAGGYSTSAFKTSNTALSERTSAANSAKIFGAIAAALAMIAAAAL